MSGSMISVPTGTETIPAYLAQPATEGKHPAVVVIHEAYGLNDNIKSVADRFANEGYVALAVDLFGNRNRAMCMFRIFSGTFFNSLDHAAIHELKATITYLEKQPNVDANRVGAIGFCMGGNLAMCWACSDQRLKVAAPFYGMLPRPLEAVARACPIVGSYPEDDWTLKGARLLDAELARHNVKHEVKIYPNAKHSFFNDQGRNYNEAAAKDAWERTLAFFKEQIG
jgi:carboxymethylenebutenolidase